MADQQTIFRNLSVAQFVGVSSEGIVDNSSVNNSSVNNSKTETNNNSLSNVKKNEASNITKREAGDEDVQKAKVALDNERSKMDKLSARLKALNIKFSAKTITETEKLERDKLITQMQDQAVKSAAALDKVNEAKTNFAVSKKTTTVNKAKADVDEAKKLVTSTSSKLKIAEAEAKKAREAYSKSNGNPAANAALKTANANVTKAKEAKAVADKNLTNANIALGKANSAAIIIK